MCAIHRCDWGGQRKSMNEKNLRIIFNKPVNHVDLFLINFLSFPHILFSTKSSDIVLLTVKIFWNI